MFSNSFALVRVKYSKQDNFLFDIERLAMLSPDKLNEMAPDVRACMVEAASQFITLWQPVLLAELPQEPLQQSSECPSAPA
jgi:hypothetical protein